MIDFATIKANHPIEDFLARRGVELKRCSGGFKGKCPVHDGDNKESLFVHAKKQYAQCWTRCGYLGSVIDLVMALDGAENALAAAEILEGRPLTEQEKQRPRPPRLEKLVLTDEREEMREEMPLPRMFRAEELKQEPQHYFETIAKARGLHWTSMKMAHDAGHVRFCRAQWRKEGEAFNCYAVLDVENPCNVQFRRMDADENGKALCFWRDVKVMGWRGNRGNWPVGIDSALAHPKATILLVEGTGDFLAAWDMRGIGMDVIPVAIFGASNTIHPRCLPFFERREVVIVQQHDAACQAAAARWEQQLRAVPARVRIWQVPEEGADLNDHIAAGHDPAVILN